MLTLASCGPWYPSQVSYEPGLELASDAAEAWNDACGVPLFEPGPDGIRFLWVDTLGGHLSRGGASVLVARDQWENGIDRTGEPFDDADRLAYLTHELGHFLLPPTGGEDGYGHYPGGVMARLNGTDAPTSIDVQHLIEEGYPCVVASVPP